MDLPEWAESPHARPESSNHPVRRLAAAARRYFPGMPGPDRPASHPELVCRPEQSREQVEVAEVEVVAEVLPPVEAF